MFTVKLTVVSCAVMYFTEIPATEETIQTNGLQRCYWVFTCQQH